MRLVDGHVLERESMRAKGDEKKTKEDLDNRDELLEVLRVGQPTGGMGAVLGDDPGVVEDDPRVIAEHAR